VSTCPECLGVGKRPEVLCTQCRGKGIEQRNETFEVLIPKGIRDGEILKMSGKGEASMSAGTPGDLYINIHVHQHAIFHRQGDDIVMRLPIKPSQAMAGSSIDIAAIDGAIKLKIPEGTQPGDILSIRGKGAYVSSGYSRGNLLIEIKVELPKKVSRKIKEIAELLGKEGY
jgi:molecular chaperone DnaJ